MQDRLKEMFTELTAFESEIRSFIGDILKAAYSANWLKQAVPKALVEDWKKKREEDVKHGKIPESNPLNYADFSQYKDIIVHNWNIFSEFFKDKETLRVRLEDLNNLCRIVTMHTRTLAEEEIGMGKVSIRWLKSRMEVASPEKKEGVREVEDIHPVFRANPFMIEDGAILVRGEKRPSEESLKRIDMQLVDSKGIPLFVEIKWTSIDVKQVSEYRELISKHVGKYRLMWVIPDDFASAAPEIESLGAEVKVFSRNDMIELVGIRNASVEAINEIKDMLTRPFEYAIQNETITFEDAIRACYFDGKVKVDGEIRRVGLKQSAIGRYLDLIRCIVVSPYADSLPELTVEFVSQILAEPYSYKHERFYHIAKDGFASISKIAHIHSSLAAIINGLWKCASDFRAKHKKRIRELYGNDIRKYDLTYRLIHRIVSKGSVMLDVKTLVTGIIDSFVMSPLQPTPKVLHTSLNQWILNSVVTSGYENDFAKRILEIAALKRILIPKRGITIMWVLAPRLQDGKIVADRVPCQSFIFNTDHTLYLEAI